MMEKEKEAAELNNTKGILDKMVAKPLEEEQQPKRVSNQDDDLKLPEDFIVARAIGGGDCFFDSVVKGLKQIRDDEEISIKLLRELCYTYSVETWVKTAVVKYARIKSNIPSALEDDQLWNAYLMGIRFTAYGMENMKRIDKVLYNTLTTPDYGETLQAPIWGRPEIEGRIICEKYGVNLHIVEKDNVGVKHQIVDKSGPKSVDSVDYNDLNTIHVVIEGTGNYKPILNTQPIQHQRWEGTTDDLDDANFYKIFIFILAKLRGQRYTDQFYLTTNILCGVGAANDIVFRFWKKEKSTVILLQAIHLDNTKYSKLAIEQFSNDNSDNIFNLTKYFADYLKTRTKIKRSDDSMFQGDFQLKYIIYTNAVLEEQFDRTRKIDIDSTNSNTHNIFSTIPKVNKKKAFKLRLNDNNSGLIAMLENVSCLKRIKSLAKALVSCINGKLNYNNMMENELLSDYHVFLAKNVINVKKEIKVDEEYIEYREGTFKHIFLNNDRYDRLEEEFKEEILYEYAKKIMFNQKPSSELDDDDIRNDLVSKVVNLITLCDKKEADVEVDESIIHHLCGIAIILDTKERTLKFADEYKLEDQRAKQFIKELKSKVNNLADYKFNISYDLVKQSLINQLEKEPLKLHVRFGNISPNFTEQKHLIEQLIKLFDKYKARKVIKIGDNVVEKVLTDGDIRNIGKLVGNLLVYDQEKKMLRLATEDTLDGIALKFIKELKTAAVQRKLEVESYRFDIKVKKFPKYSLDVNGEDRTKVEDFFNDLEVFSDQASDQDFKTIIKNEIKNLYKLTDEETDDTFLNLKEKSEEYCRTRKNLYYLEKYDDFFRSTLMFHTIFTARKPVESFTGRVQQLNKLHKALQSSSDTAISQVASISGHGGIGKTELARKYASDFKYYYAGNVIWINAESYQTLFESFRSLAQDKLGINVKEMNLKCIVDEVYDFYAHRNRTCLFIFDNAEKFDTDEGLKILPSLPANAKKPFILIISRKQLRGNIEVIPLETFTEKEATEFIIKELQIEDDSQNNEIQKLLEILDLFPLALTQAVTCIKQVDEEVKHVNPERSFKIYDYLKECEEVNNKILDLQFSDDSNDKFKKTMFTSSQVCIDKIRKEEFGKEALKFLDIIAYCAPDNITSEIFLNLAHDEDDAKRGLKSAVQLLIQYFMVNSDDGLLSVHKLVQEVIRMNLMGEKREEKTLRKALELLKYCEYRCEYPPSCIMWKNNTSKNGETFGIWRKHNILCGRSIFIKDTIKLTNTVMLSDIERHASYIWNYASKYDQLVRDYYSAYGEEKNTPINLFAISGEKNAIESLLKNIQNNRIDTLNEFNKIGYAPIHSAAFYGHKEIVKYLIEEQDVDVNFFTNNNENTPVGVAVLGNQLHILQYLLRIKGADPNKRGKKGQLPIHYAAQNAKMDLIECLVDNKANIFITDELTRNNVLHYALRHLKICNMHLSVVEEIVRNLLEKNSSLGSSSNKSGMTPLHLASELGYSRIVKTLLDYGANVNVRSFSFESRLPRCLLNIRDPFGTKKLIDQIKIQSPNNHDNNYNKGYTPLHIAAKENYLEIVKLLLQKGAIYDNINDEKMTPSNIAELDSDVKNLLVTIDRSFKAVMNGNKDELDGLLSGKDTDQLKSILNARNRRQRTLLQVATNEQVNIIQLLVEKLILCSGPDQV